MKNIPPAALALLLPVAGWTAGPLNGTWKIEIDTAHRTGRPDLLVLQNGTYTCRTCTPPYTVKADGTDQPVAGQPNFDDLSVAVIDERTVLKSARQAGRAAFTEKFTVSPDGNAAIDEITFTQSGVAVTKSTLQRLAAGPPGAHAISGSWRTESLEAPSNTGIVAFQMSTGAITMTRPTGQSYTASLDGREAPYHGEPAITTVSVRKIDPHLIQESDGHNGYVTQVIRWSVDPDGRTLHARIDDRLRNNTLYLTGHKQ